ncbi:MAG: S8 family serine peptidase [Bacteroidales bacterium]|nr:S8 family serine peptidase [Bacteroidales bacterium]
MKFRMLLLCGLALALSACVRQIAPSELEIPEEQAADIEQNYYPGRMTLLVNEELAEQLELRTDEEGYVSGSKTKALSFPFDELGIVRMRRLFREAGKFEARTRAEGLHRFYVVEFDPAKSLTKAAAGFVSIPGVDRAEMDPRIKLVGDPEVVAYATGASAAPAAEMPFDDPRLPQQWHYYNDGSASSSLSGCDINVFPVWENYTTGNPDVVVCVVDAGVDYEHEDLADNMWNDPDVKGRKVYGYNFCNNSAQIVAGDHGTHVAGTIAAVNNNGLGVSGIAGGNQAAGQAGVKIMSCQIFGEGGSGSGVEAIKWGADHGAVISQNSWGYEDVDTAPLALKAAVDYFNKYAGLDADGNQVGPMAGGVVIFAAGNEDRDLSCADYEGIVSVASVGADYRRAYYSCYGDWVSLSAPGGDVKKGNQILSTLPGNKYGYMQGTSMACPHVSGVAALLVSRFGKLGFTATALKKLLVENTTDISSYNRSFQMGSGLVNAYKAIAGTGGVAPDPVTGFSVSAKSNSVSFKATVPADSDDTKPSSIIIYYSTAASFDPADAMFGVFYVGSAKVGETLEGTITGLDFNKNYYFRASACDLAGNTSEPTEAVLARTGKNNAPVITVNGPVEFRLKAHETASLPFTYTDPDGHYMQIVLEQGSPAETLDTLDKSRPRVDISAVLAETGSYRSRIVVTDLYGASTTQEFSYTVLENHKPEQVGRMDDLLFGTRGAVVELQESDFFSDEDGEQLSYKITNSDEAVANVNYSRGVFYVTALGLGYANVDITATDIRGEQVSQQFRILVRESSEPVDVYPNPVSDYLYVRTSEEASVDLKLVSLTGATMFEDQLTITPFEPARVDVKGYAPGNYTVILDYAGETITKSIVKL